MAGVMRVSLEVGPKGKKVVAVAPDWPGLARGANSGRPACVLWSHAKLSIQGGLLHVMDRAESGSFEHLSGLCVSQAETRGKRTCR
jgi:hypothetical protein